MGTSVTCSVNKGEIGKTTTAGALAQTAHYAGLSVAVFDIHPKRNGTYHFTSHLGEMNGLLLTSDSLMAYPFTLLVAFVRHTDKDMKPASIEELTLNRPDAEGFAIVGADRKL